MTIPTLSGLSVEGTVDSKAGKLMGKVTTMPAASSCKDCVVLYEGTSGTYIPHTFYKSDGTSWTSIGKVVTVDTSVNSGSTNPVSGGAVASRLSNYQGTITGAATSIASSNLTANRALISNASGKVAVSAVSSTKLGYLTDVTSNIQAQINGVKTTADGAIQQGDSLNAPLTVTGGDQNTAGKVILDQGNKGQITDTSTATLLGFTSADTLIVGSSSYNTALRGKQARPIWNGSSLALSSDVPSNYVPNTRTVNGKALSSNISLTASDVGALASNGTAARATADADGHNIASTYATKSEVTSIPKFDVKVVTSLPTSNISTSTIYLKQSATAGTSNVYDEYLYVNSKWEVIGTTMTDLSGYSTKANTIKALSISGRTITYTRGDDTTGTLTTQDTNTDTKVQQSNSTSSTAYPILLKNGTGTGAVTSSVLFNSSVTLQPSTGTITATKFKGELEGKATLAAAADTATTATNATHATSAASATKATQDGDGKNIASTYLKKTDAANTYATVLRATGASVTWTANTTMAGFSYRGQITLTGCTVDHTPIVSFTNAQARSGDYCPVAETYAGGIYIWSKKNTAITVDVMAVK